MVSYEDARKFRENASAPLAWDEDVPPSPCDRIELTRRILEAAEAVGLDFPAWDRQFPSDDPKKKMVAFQRELRQTIPHQKFKGIPKGTQGESGSANEIFLLIPLTGAKYIGQLEDDYYKPWETSWRLGECADSRQNTLSFVKKTIAEIAENLKRYPPGYCGEGYRPPDVEKISGPEIVAEYLPSIVGLELSRALRWDAILEPPLVEERWLGLPELWAFYVPPVVGLICIIGSIFGAVQGHYPGWLLLAIIPMLILATTAAFLKTTHATERQWINKPQTFDELAEKIVELKKREWAELQRTYIAP